MTLPEEGYLLRIFVGESDLHGAQALHEWLVLKAREMGLAGATVLRGLMGFGAHSRIHTFKIERLLQDLPMIVEIPELGQPVRYAVGQAQTLRRRRSSP